MHMTWAFPASQMPDESTIKNASLHMKLDTRDPHQAILLEAGLMND